MRAVVFRGAGGNEVVHLDERPDPVPEGDEVLVRVRWAGLNPADTSQRRGFYPAPPGSPPDIPGLEVAGAVEAVGPHVARLAPGEMVMGLIGGGGLADRVAAPERCLVPIPDGLEERDAAGVPEAFVTAHDAVRTQAGLSPGEVLLVHGAAGGVGTAAVQIGVAVGARVLGTVRSPRSAALVQELGGEPVDDDGFAEAVLERTDGHGADVVLELVGAPHFPANLEAIAEQARVMIVGTGAGADIALPLRNLMSRRASIRGTMLRHRPPELKAAAVQRFGHELRPLFAAGRLRAVIDSVYPAERVTEAFDRLDGPGKTGKVLLEL
jgi:putative PIG3 family NAD(P)H quinone oxidoreductase